MRFRVTLLYLRYRAIMAWSQLKPGRRRDWGYAIVIALAIFCNLPAVGFVYLGLYRLFGEVATNFGIETLERLFHLPAGGFGVFLVFLVLNRVYPVLFESADGELLRSLPISAPGLAHLRLSGLGLLLAPVLLLFAPLAAFYGIYAGAPPSYYPIGAVLIACFGLTVLGVCALLTELLALSVPQRGVRGLSRYGTVIFLVPFGFGFFLLLPMARQATGIIDQILALADRFAFGPAAWMVDGLAAAAAGAAVPTLLAGAALLGLAIGSWGGCLALAPVLARRDVVEPPPRPAGAASGIGWWAPGWLAPASRALWRRELTAVREEAARSLLLPAVMVVFLTVMNRFMATGWPMHFIIGLMAISTVGGLTMSAIGQEGRAFWILRTLPIPVWRVLAVKLVVRTGIAVLFVAAMVGLFSAVSSTAASSGAADVTGSPSVMSTMGVTVDDRLVPWLASTILAALVLSGIWGLATGARFPEFIPKRKGQYVGIAASLYGTFGSFAITGSLLLSLLPLQVDALLPLLWFLPLAVFAFWLAACLLYLAWAGWHLERLEQ